MKTLFAFIKRVLFMTGITLPLLACAAALLGGSCIFIRTIFENLLLNVCLCLALSLTGRWESKYFLLDAALDIGVILILVLGFAWLFGWFASTPFWVLALLITVTYLLGIAFELFRIRSDVQAINKLLENRKGDSRP